MAVYARITMLGNKMAEQVVRICKTCRGRFDNRLCKNCTMYIKGRQVKNGNSLVEVRRFVRVSK